MVFKFMLKGPYVQRTGKRNKTMVQRSMIIVGLIWLTGVASAQENDDRKIAEANRWIYDDLDKGIERARAATKPLMVVIRCPP